LSHERRHRAEKILHARQRAVDVAEAELATLVRESLQAEIAADGARAFVEARMRSQHARECSSEDLGREHTYILALAKYAEVMADLARGAKAREEVGRLKVCNAKTEHKKVETWRDRLVEGIQSEEARIERLQGDEVAARIARRA
jgi:hypothetical protein